jgi:hypothetical protein
MSKIQVVLCISLCLSVVLPLKSYALNAIKVPVAGDKIEATDYADSGNWLSLPNQDLKNVDIFFIYPTAWRAKEGQYPVAKIDNTEMRHWADFYLKTEGSAFETVGNIYAPYYRQLDALFVFEATKKGGTDLALKYFGGIPKTDIFAAFDYYIKHYNKGKPFILVGHSQGSAMTLLLLIQYMKENPDVYKRMIAAYPIGIPITKQIYAANPHLKPAKGALDTGVIISYNVESPKVDGQNFLSNPDSVLINPLSWKTTDELVPATKNLGSLIIEGEKYKKVEGFADAQINNVRGVIICTTANPEQFSSQGASRVYFPLGILHQNDIPLYYYNLRQNAQSRTEQYLKKFPL